MPGGEIVPPGGCPARSAALRGTLDFIEQHYHEHLTLQDVAHAVNFTPAYLTDLLRRETGLSIHRWIVEYRLSEAKRLLLDTEMPVAAVGQAAGFGNASNFCRQFLKRTGCSPRQWRKTKWQTVAPEAGREMLQSLLDEIPQLVWAKDAEGKLLYANKQWYAYTGQTIAESAGWGWLAAVHPCDVKRCLTKWRSALAQGAPLEYRVRLRRAADARYRWHLFRTNLQRENGTFRWIGTGTDVHDDVTRGTDERDAA
jgi:PAS domain S-box-containing protein